MKICYRKSQNNEWSAKPSKDGELFWHQLPDLQQEKFRLLVHYPSYVYDRYCLVARSDADESVIADELREQETRSLVLAYLNAREQFFAAASQSQDAMEELATAYPVEDHGLLVNQNVQLRPTDALHSMSEVAEKVRCFRLRKLEGVRIIAADHFYKTPDEVDTDMSVWEKAPEISLPGTSKKLLIRLGITVAAVLLVWAILRPGPPPPPPKPPGPEKVGSGGIRVSYRKSPEVKWSEKPTEHSEYLWRLLTDSKHEKFRLLVDYLGNADDSYCLVARSDAGESVIATGLSEKETRSLVLAYLKARDQFFVAAGQAQDAVEKLIAAYPVGDHGLLADHKMQLRPVEDQRLLSDVIEKVRLYRLRKEKGLRIIAADHFKLEADMSMCIDALGKNPSDSLEGSKCPTNSSSETNNKEVINNPSGATTNSTSTPTNTEAKSLPGSTKN